MTTRTETGNGKGGWWKAIIGGLGGIVALLMLLAGLLSSLGDSRYARIEMVKVVAKEICEGDCFSRVDSEIAARENQIAHAQIQLEVRERLARLEAGLERVEAGQKQLLDTLLRRGAPSRRAP
jgi:hypothetical protein